jgi:hypothetical protein
MKEEEEREKGGLVQRLSLDMPGFEKSKCLHRLFLSNEMTPIFRPDYFYPG